MIEAVDEELEVETDDEPFELPEPEYRQPKTRSGFNAFKPGTRQPAPKAAKTTGELPWYARVKPGESMMSAAATELARMNASREAKKVSGRVNE